MNAVDLIQTTLVPVIFISSVGLIGLIIQTRYGRVHDRVRLLLSERRSISQDTKRVESLDLLIEQVLDRARMLKWALIVMLSAIVVFVLDSLFTLLNVLTGTPPDYAILAVFTVGMLLVAAAAALMVIDASESVSNLKLEVKIETQA